MITLKVDGSEVFSHLGDVKTMGDLVEFVKATIDPDKIITEMLIDGNALSDEDWRVPLNAHPRCTVEVQTGGKGDFVTDRVRIASSIVDQIIMRFEGVAALFEQNKREDANFALKKAVEDLSAFIDWYNSILLIDEVAGPQRLRLMQGLNSDLAKVCEQLVQHMLYQSWWAISQTLQIRLVPELRRLSKACDEFAQSGSA